MKFRVGARLLEGRTRNVSRGGLCATLVDPIALGTNVELELVLVFDNEVQSDALRLPARVVWCTQVDEASQIGVLFRPLDTARAKQLELFLTFLDDQEAERRPRAANIDDRFR